MQGLLGCFLTTFLLGTPSAVDDALNRFPDREVVQCVEGKDADIDGDGKQDVVCITHQGDDDPQRLTVILSSAPANVPPSIDAPILKCSHCAGKTPINVEISTIVSQGDIVVSETGGADSTWVFQYLPKRSNPRFRLAREGRSYDDSEDGASEGMNTEYKDGVGESRRTTVPPDAASCSAEFFNVYAMPRSGPIKIDGYGGETAWQRALKLPVNREKYAILERSEIKSDTDLSYGLRALWDKDFLYLLVEVSDDTAVFAPRETSGVRYDHLEIWFHHGSLTNGFDPRMKPDPEETFQLGLVPVQGTGQVRVMRWFPAGGELSRAIAAYHKTRTGYVVEARLPLERLGAAKDGPPGFDFYQERDGLINMTVIASDTDMPKAPRQEKMLATSHLEHFGAPFELGLLHLMKSKRPDDVSDPRGSSNHHAP